MKELFKITYSAQIKYVYDRKFMFWLEEDYYFRASEFVLKEIDNLESLEKLKWIILKHKAIYKRAFGNESEWFFKKTEYYLLALDIAIDIIDSFTKRFDIGNIV